MNPDDVASWPPPFSNFVEAPAGELPASRFVPTTDALEWAHKALQVLFMFLALIGIVILLGASGPRAVLRGAARKHAVA